ncbi:hypothetical protein [Rhizobium bangladeshense]|uniref:hypothetical protein n=1 Tax=Rhizobium bangladeshense TaxID=1138189 RepID=UPI0007E59831|nr:hypothetical protein [Rhizobium bangladeshense]
MAYEVELYIASTHASITVKDWLSDSPCVDVQTGKKLENVPVNPRDTFHVLIGQQDGVGAVIIHETVSGVTHVPTEYEIPADLDGTGKITFPKGKSALQSQLDNLDAQVKALASQAASNKPGSNEAARSGSQGTARGKK